MLDPTRKKAAARLDQVGERLCDECGERFTHIKDAARYCSHRCKQRAHRRRRDAGKITDEIEVDIVEVEEVLITTRLLHPLQTDDKRRVRAALEEGLRAGLLRVTPAGDRDV